MPSAPSVASAHVWLLESVTRAWPQEVEGQTQSHVVVIYTARPLVAEGRVGWEQRPVD